MKPSNLSNHLRGVLGIDPGLTGAFVGIANNNCVIHKTPLTDKEIDFEAVRLLLESYKGFHVFLERAMPLAMGAKHAFNYGRGFAALEIAIRLSGLPVVYVEPARWTKVMLEGVDARLKAKERSQIAVRRLFPKLIPSIPANKNEKLHEGIVDALLIAEYGRRKLGGIEQVSKKDF